MRIYTFTSKQHGEEPAGTRIEADVVRVAVYDPKRGNVTGYTVGEFRSAAEIARAGARASGWHLMRRTYRTLAGLLLAVERAGYNVDAQSAGIK